MLIKMKMVARVGRIAVQILRLDALNTHAMVNFVKSASILIVIFVIRGAIVIYRRVTYEFAFVVFG